MIMPDSEILRLEKRQRGLQRVATAINDLSIYGIYHTNFTTSFTSVNYGHSHTNITNVNFIGGTVDNDYVQLASSIKQRNADWTGTSSDNASTNDSLYFHIQEFGDLA